jgi:hypothetical protein
MLGVTGAAQETAPVKIAASPEVSAAQKTRLGATLEVRRLHRLLMVRIAFRARREELSISPACCIAKTYFFRY